jgi:hypothetical protein
MFKRAIWIGAGFSAGLGSSFWVKRAVNRRVDRYVPPDVRTAVSRGARKATSTVRTAVHEGRAAMHQFQTETEAKVEPTGTTSLRVVGD